MNSLLTKLEQTKIGGESVFNLIREHLAEFIGTAILTAVGSAGGVMGRITVTQPDYDRVNLTGRAIANGLTIAMLILNLGGISGAHFNPAVSLAFTLRTVFPWLKMLTYWICQFGGALAGAAIIRGIFPIPPELMYGLRPIANLYWSYGLYTEIFLTFVLVFTILGTATRHRVLGSSSAFAVGAWIATALLVTGPLSGGVMNPAVASAAIIISGDLNYAWIYVVAEMAGALIAVAVTWLLHPRPKEPERETALGDVPEAEKKHRPSDEQA